MKILDFSTDNPIGQGRPYCSGPDRMQCRPGLGPGKIAVPRTRDRVATGCEFTECAQLLGPPELLFFFDDQGGLFVESPASIPKLFGRAFGAFRPLFLRRTMNLRVGPYLTDVRALIHFTESGRAKQVMRAEELLFVAERFDTTAARN